MQENCDKDGWCGFLQLIYRLKNPRQLEEVLTFFLTIEEKKDLSLRFLLVKELLKGELTQREISAKLKVSIAKITRGSNALKIVDKNITDLINT